MDVPLFFAGWSPIVSPFPFMVIFTSPEIAFCLARRLMAIVFAIFKSWSMFPINQSVFPSFPTKQIWSFIVPQTVQVPLSAPHGMFPLVVVNSTYHEKDHHLHATRTLLHLPPRTTPHTNALPRCMISLAIFLVLLRMPPLHMFPKGIWWVNFRRIKRRWKSLPPLPDSLSS